MVFNIFHIFGKKVFLRMQSYILVLEEMRHSVVGTNFLFLALS